MPAPRSVRFDESTIERLTAYCLKRPGLSLSGAAAALVEEGLRMDLHPGIIFRDGPSGRRAALVGGPDVWEVIRAIKQLRTQEPAIKAGEAISVIADATGVAGEVISCAVNYYAAFPDEVEAEIAQADLAEEQAYREHTITKQLLEA